MIPISHLGWKQVAASPMKIKAQPSNMDYYHYLIDKSWLRRLIRKFYLKDIVRHLRGKLLDVGCGAGELLEVYPASFGSDLNPMLVKYCHDSGHLAVIADCIALPFISGSYDCLVMSNLLEHLEYPLLALKEAARLLKAGGVLVVTVPYEAGFKFDPTHVTWVREDQIKELTSWAGLMLERLYSFPLGGKFLGSFFYFIELRAVMRKQD